MPGAGNLHARRAEDPDNRVGIVVEEIEQQRQLRDVQRRRGRRQQDGQLVVVQ
jgi:hypothetical protein